MPFYNLSIALCLMYSFHAQFHTHRTGQTFQLGLFQPFAYGGEGRNRPYFPAVAPQICLISLGIQANTVLSDRIVFNPFGVRFGVRDMKSLMQLFVMKTDRRGSSALDR
jgi:hypothetical protein